MQLRGVTQSRIAKKFRLLPLVLLLLYANTHSRESPFSTSPLLSGSLSTAGASATNPQNITEDISTDLEKEGSTTSEQEVATELEREILARKEQIPLTDLTRARNFSQ